MISSGQDGTWRRGREVLDDYDVDRVLSEELADDLVNELACLRPRSRRLPGPGVRVLSAPVVPGRRPALRVLRGGLAP